MGGYYPTPERPAYSGGAGHSNAPRPSGGGHDFSGILNREWRSGETYQQGETRRTRERYNQMTDFEKLMNKEIPGGKKGPSVPSAQRALNQAIRFAIRRNPWVQLGSLALEFILAQDKTKPEELALPPGFYAALTCPQSGKALSFAFKTTCPGGTTAPAISPGVNWATVFNFGVWTQNGFPARQVAWYTRPNIGSYPNQAPYWAPGRRVGWLPAPEPLRVLNPYPMATPLPQPISIPSRLIPARDALQEEDPRNQRGYGTALMPKSLRIPNIIIKPGEAVKPGAPDHKPEPPGPGRKERKFALALPSGALSRIYGFVGEAGDFIDAFHDALPDECKAKPVKIDINIEKRHHNNPNLRDYHKWRFMRDNGYTTQTLEQYMADKKPSQNRTYRAPSSWEKAEALYKCFDKMDLAAGLKNLALNQVEDYVLGRIGQVAAKANRKNGRPAGLQFGPAM